MPSSGWVKTVKKCRFSTSESLNSETIENTHIVTMETNRKSHVLSIVTNFDDLE